MLNYKFFKENIIIFLFLISVFFSHTVVKLFPHAQVGTIAHYLNFNIPFRFIFLLTSFFLFYDYFKLKKLPKKNITVALVAISLIFLHSFIYQTHLLKILDFPYKEFYQNEQIMWEQFDLTKKLLIQCGVIFLTVMILIEYKNLLYNNIFKIINGYVLILVILLTKFYYDNFLMSGIDLNILFGCNHGFFYLTNFLYRENSHFHLLSPAIIIYFAYNFKDYLKYKLLFVLNILFVLFVFSNFSLTFYLGLNLGLIATFICCRNLNKISVVGFIVLLVISNAMFFKDSKLSFCKADSYEQLKPILHLNPSNRDIFRGGIETPRTKLFSNGLTGQTMGLSGSVTLYSIQFAIKNLIKYPLGVGMSNYILAFKNNLKFDSAGEIWEGLEINPEKFPKFHSSTLHFNQSDGSIIFSKLLIEFGFLTLFTFLFILHKLLKLDLNNDFKLIIICFLIPQIFVRASGYFYNGLFIWALLLIVVILMKKNPNKLN